MWLLSSLRGMDQLGRTTALMRLGCVLMIAAAGLRAVYAAVFEAEFFTATPYLWIQWAVAYAVFVLAYAAASWLRVSQRFQIALLVAQSAAALFMIWLYPNFIVTALLVVVAWQIAWATTLRQAVMSVVLLSLLLTLMKCVDQNSSMSLLVLITTSGFELFAVAAAHLARNEAMAARMAERLRISRDLHDILGHNLTSLTIRLDVASRMTQGEAAEHLQIARGIAAKLLDEVRAVVREVRVQPVDLRAALHSLTQGLVGLRVHLILPEALAPLDPPRADAVLRCAQELITNTLRHAQAQELTIELQQNADGSIAISAHDDGRGGDVVEGHGLAGMRERFELLGGTLSFASAPGEGFTVRGRIPVGVMP
jgi:signal transduction histidine kinase